MDSARIQPGLLLFQKIGISNHGDPVASDVHPARYSFLRPSHLHSADPDFNTLGAEEAILALKATFGKVKYMRGIVYSASTFFYKYAPIPMKNLKRNRPTPRPEIEAFPPI